MTKIYTLKLAIQKDGRLTDETLDFLRRTGLLFEVGKQRLFSPCINFPLEILYLRDDDIPRFVELGMVDLGIIGQNVLYEQKRQVKKLLNLRFGFCSLVVAAPRESAIQRIEDLKNLTLTTAYPNSAKKFFKEKNVSVKVLKISGSVEVTPMLGIASAIVDLVSTGSTLLLNDLRIITKIYDSEAVLIGNLTSLLATNKKEIIDKLLIRFKAVLSAKNYKYIVMSIEAKALSKIVKISPGLKSPTVSQFAKEGLVSVQSVVKEDIFWETIERLKREGAERIIVLPIEKIIL